MSGIHQFVPMLHRHDAVGDHTLAIRDRLVAAGVPSRIYTEVPDPATAMETRHYLDYEADAAPGDVLVYQFATHSAIARWLVARGERLVVNYHSITPPEFFARWDNRIARLQVDCLGDLAAIAPRADLGIAVSRFDEDELRSAGCRKTVVCPVASLGAAAEPDPVAIERLRRRRSATGASWLTVGRSAPNKAHHRTIAALFVTRMTTDPGARLTLVGAPSEPNYATALRRYASSLGLAGAVEFVSGISDAELAARYRSSDVLVMLSEHEGFGVPLVEAMRSGLPVVAGAAGAVAEVMGDAGLLLDRTHPRHVATEVGRLLANPGEMHRMVAAGRARVAALGIDAAGDLMVEALRGVAGLVGAPS